MKRDQRGAIIVMALPMALFLIGMLHYAIGIGDAIIARETMQDAADASAFSAAVMMARGMNLIVLINVVMASLLAILVMLRLTYAMILVGIALCSLMAWVTGGTSAGYIPALRVAEKGVDKAYTAARGIVNPALLGLHTTATVLRYAMPVAAEARVIDTSRRYAPPAIVGFAFPNQFALPTEDGTEDQLCGKAGEYAAKIATLPIGWLLPESVLEVLEDGLGGVTEALAFYFCSSSSTGAPPPIPIPQGNVRQQLPKLPTMRECEDFVSDSDTVDPEHQRSCEQAREDMAMAEPDPRTGACAQADCTAYQQRIELARTECVPTPRGRIDEWVWQERDVTWWSRLDDTHPHSTVERQPLEYSAPRLMRGSTPPCGRDGVVSHAWSTIMTQPLCTEAHETIAADGPLIDRSAPLDVTYREVMHVLGCSKPVPMVSPMTEIDGDDTPPPLEPSSQGRCGAQQRVHQNVKAGVALGGETFQLRAVVLGEKASERQRNILDAVVLREKGTESPWSGFNVSDALQHASRLFVAQAEYYFDADVGSGKGRDPLEWMWTMDWRARLVRFRLPDDSAAPPARNENRCGVTPPTVDVTSACELAQGGDACAGVESSLGNLADLTLH